MRSLVAEEAGGGSGVGDGGCPGGTGAGSGGGSGGRSGGAEVAASSLGSVAIDPDGGGVGAVTGSDGETT